MIRTRIVRLLGSGVFSLPGDVRVSGTYQNIAGVATLASYVNKAIAIGSLGRNLSGGGVDPQFNLYNLTNANDVVSENTRYGASWRNVTAVLPPRMVKLGMHIDF